MAIIETGRLAWKLTNPRTRAIVEQGNIIFDVLKEENAKFSAKLTEFDVETGVKPADHYQPEAVTVSLQIVICAFSVTLKGGGSLPDETVMSSDREMEIYRKLRRFRDEAVVLSYLTPKDSYENMMLTELSHSRTWETGKDALAINITLQQLKAVQTRTTQVKRLPANAKQNLCETPKDAGTKTAVKPKQELVSDFYANRQQSGNILGF